MPRTIEGRSVLDALNRAGVWKRAGLTGLVSGLDLREALASLPAGCDRGLAKRLLIIGEAAYLGAVLQREGKGKSDGE